MVMGVPWSLDAKSGAGPSHIAFTRPEELRARAHTHTQTHVSGRAVGEQGVGLTNLFVMIHQEY